MIEATAPFAALAARLTAKARRLAEAHARNRRDDPRRWRRPALLWPLFGED